MFDHHPAVVASGSGCERLSCRAGRRRPAPRLCSALAAAACLTVAGAALPPAAGAAPAVTVTVRKGVVYGKARVAAPVAGSTRLLLDLEEPAKRSKVARPVVVVIHGGGFTKQSRTDAGIVRTARGLAARGVFAVDGDADPTVPVALDDQLVRALAQHVRVEYHRVPGGVHGYDGSRFFTQKVAGSRTPFDRLLRFATTALRP